MARGRASMKRRCALARHARRWQTYRCAWFGLITVIAATLNGPVAAADVAPDAPATAASSASAAEAGAPPKGPAAAASSSPAAPERSLLLPAFEIIGFDFLLNRIDRYVGTGRDDYRVTLATIRRNLKSDWSTDHDPFKINQLGHPYQGS